MSPKTFFLALAITGLIPPTLVLASEAASKSFITKAIEGNLAEIELGKLAQVKGQSDAVKQYGKMIETDHSQANEKAVQAANSLGVTPPTAPDANAQRGYRRLQRESGTQFDRSFTNDMVMDHRKDIADYRKEARQGNDAVTQYANDSIPTLEKHLKNAQALTSTQARQ
jgi:putative membrane protein